MGLVEACVDGMKVLFIATRGLDLLGLPLGLRTLIHVWMQSSLACRGSMGVSSDRGDFPPKAHVMGDLPHSPWVSLYTHVITQ